MLEIEGSGRSGFFALNQFLARTESSAIALSGNWRFNAGKTGQGVRLSKLLGLLQIKGAFCAADIHNKRLALVIAT